MAIEFNTEFYLQSKFNQLESEGLLEQFELTDVASLAQFFEDNGVDAREHYLAVGMAEGINPSAEFDTNAYLEAKLADLQNADKYGDEFADFTVQDVIEAFQASGLTALEHFNEFGEAEGLEATPVEEEASELTEALADYEAAVKARDTAFDDFVEAAEAANLTGYADDVAPADYIEAAITQAEDILAQDQADLAGARAATVHASAAAAGTFSASATDTGFNGTQFDLAGERDAATSGFAGFFNEDLIEASQRLSDARLEKLVADAQAALTADSNRYDKNGAVLFEADATYATAASGVEEGDFVPGEYSTSGVVTAAKSAASVGSGDVLADADVFSARQLQSKLNAANSDLNGDINRKGTNFEIGAQLNASIAALLEGNTDPASLNDVLTQYNAWKDGVEAGTAQADTAPTAYLDALAVSIAAVFEDVTTGTDFATYSNATTGDMGKADTANVIDGVPSGLASLLASFDSRFEKEAAVDAAEGVLGNTPSGFDFLLASAMQADREGLVEDVNNGSELIDTLTGLKGDYETAVADAANAAEALGYDVVEVEDGILFGEAATDELFIFNTESLQDLGFTSVTLEELEAGDALFFGTQFQAGSDIEAGNNNVQEIFVTTNNAGDVVLEVENSVFGSAQDDTLAVTLTGISEDQVTIDGGVVSIA